MTDLLKDNEIKNTKNRRIILDVLSKSPSPITAEEIYSSCISYTHLNLSTIYRTLALLSSHNIVIKATNHDGKDFYCLNSHTHCHYLICSKCGKMLEINDCPLEKLEKKLIKETGFTISEHSLQFIGLCPECANKHDR